MVEAGDEVYPEEVVVLACDLATFDGDEPSEAVVALLEARTAARDAKDGARADAIRDGLAACGVTIEDTPQGPRAVMRSG
jgi:cysteinyl-tRNA synthetase